MLYCSLPERSSKLVKPQPPNAVEVFYSYSHKDEELRDQLENHLSMLKREGVIKGWHDRRISAGQEWEGQIDSHLNSADIILLLVSSDLLASAYCYDVEVKRAMERHEAGEARVIPIILRSCDWKRAPFGKLQALPKDATPVKKWDDTDDAFLNIAEGLRKAAEEIGSSRGADSSATAEPPTDEPARPNPALYIPDVLRVDFVNRQDSEGRDIVERLKDELAPSKKRLNALWGSGGVGKTAIAAEAARGLSGAFAQRVVWASADGRADFSLSTLLDEIATQLRQPDLRKLTLELKREQVRELVQEPPTLIVLDNFETIEPEKAKPCVEWLAQPALCAALVTTRDKVEEARNFPLTPMSSDEARTLLQRLISQVHDPRVFANLNYDRVIVAADANPLVLQWIFGQIDLAQDPDEVLDDLKHGEGTAAERVFDRSFNLKQLNNGGRAVLLALSLFAPSATRKALADVAGLGKEKDRKRFKDAVKTLSALWFIRATDDSQRLVVEGLTRELTKVRLSQDTPRAATFRQRFVARFLSLAESNSRPTAEHLNAVEAERDNILNAMNVASETGDGKSLLRIRSALGEFLIMRGYWDEAVRSGEQALNVARNLSDENWIATIAHKVAVTHQNRGEVSKAHRLYDESLEIKQRLGNQSGVAITLHQLAALAQDQGHTDEARKLYGESLEINKRLDDQSTVAKTLHNLAAISQDQGDTDEARKLYDESMEIKRRLGDQHGVAITLHELGRLAQNQGDLEEARKLYGESLEIKKRLGDQRGVAVTLHELGRLAQAQGDLGEARKLYDESMEIERRLGNQSGVAATLHQLAMLAQAQGDLGEARKLYDESLEIKKRLGDQSGVAITLDGLGLLEKKEGNVAEAERLLSESLSIFERLGSPNAKIARRHLEGLKGKTD
jgi:tetratricopeptide (TPR) repeat protein